MRGSILRYSAASVAVSHCDCGRVLKLQLLRKFRLRRNRSTVSEAVLHGPAPSQVMAKPKRDLRLAILSECRRSDERQRKYYFGVFGAISRFQYFWPVSVPENAGYSL